MGKFIATVIGALALAAALLFGLSQALCPQHPNNPSIPYGIQVANTGSSHGGHGFNYEEFGDLVTCNFAMNAQTPWYDDSLVDYYIDHFADKAELNIVISYFSFWETEVEDEQFEWKNPRYTEYVDAAHMRYKTLSDAIITTYFPIIKQADEAIGTIFAEGEAPTADTTDEADEAEGGDGAGREMVNGQLVVKNPDASQGYTREEIGRLRAEYHLTYTVNPDGSLKPMTQSEIDAIEHMIRNCQAHGITPHLVTTPYLDEYARWYDFDDFKQAFYGEIDRICQTYGVDYRDFSHDERFAHSPELFSDTDHLNPDGAKMFTALVLADEVR